MLVIDKFSRKPIYEQIIEGIEREILTGILAEREQLPSIRELSVMLSINPNTISKAFLELDRAGIIISSQGRGCFVAADAIMRIQERLIPKISEIQNLASELASAGIDEEAVHTAIRAAYEEHFRKDETK
jgi:GntR family transcriptional regulator